jgi:general secretion pathway protein G
LSEFSVALNMFENDCGRYPTTAEGLAALIKRPSNIPPDKWRRKYLDVDRIFMDPWGRPFVYRCPGLHNTNSFDLFSCGEDGESKSGGDDPDDINNWNRNSPLVGSDGGALPAIAGSLAVFLVVLALAWAERRFWKTEGNLHGVFALLWFATAPLLWAVLEKKQVGSEMGYLAPFVGVGWFIPLMCWTISGERRGSPLSKSCAFVVIILLLLLLLAGIVRPGWT